MKRHRFPQLRFGIVVSLFLAVSAAALGSETTDPKSEIRARIKALLATSESWATADAEVVDSVWAKSKSVLEADLSTAVDELDESLFEGAPEHRIAAARLLGKIGGFGATEALRSRMVNDPSPEVKKVALESWVEASAFPQIVELLRKSPAGIPETLGTLISEVPEGIEPIPVPQLPRNTVSPDLAKRAAERVPAVIEDAIFLSSGPHGAITKAYFSESQERELRSLGVSAIPPLAEAYSKDRFRRELAGSILSDFGGATLFESLAPMILSHEAPEIRSHLRRLLLARADFDGLVQVLARLIREEPETPAGRYAQTVLAACRSSEE